MRFQLQSCIKYVWYDRPCMFNRLLNNNVLRIILVLNHLVQKYPSLYVKSVR